MVARAEDVIPHRSQLWAFITRWLLTTNHKEIGTLYLWLSFVLFFIAGAMAMVIRLELFQPGIQFAEPAFYNQMVTMHGLIMVFGVVMPGFVGLANWQIPLMIGAPDMAFPRLNMMSYQAFLIGGLIMLGSFFAPGGAASSGWTSYAPLSVIATMGQTAWLVGMIFLIASSLLGAINFIVTILHLRADGMTFFRMPFFVWSQLVTAFLLLLAFPPLQVAAIFQLMDRLADTSFFLPTGLVSGGEPVAAVGGGSPLLWQHLFWFLAHPEVYVLILPGMGIVAEVIANNTRKPLWGYRPMVYSLLFLGFMSFGVWAHHMYMTGMGTTMSTFFQITTMIISIPSVIILTCMVISLWGASIRFTVPMLFALAFLPMFGIGGLTGLPLGLAAPDAHFHDTYYVIGHFHYVVAPGTIFAMFAGIYYWYPKATGRLMNETLGRIHFWASLVFMNGIVMPMMFEGMAGVSRRLFDPSVYVHAEAVHTLTMMTSWSAWLLALSQIPFIINFFWSMRKEERAEENPWQATTLEWATPTPPPHGNFLEVPVVYSGPYEYSVPGAASDFSPQFLKQES